MNVYDYKNMIAHVVWAGCGIRVMHAFARFYNFGDNALAYGVQSIFMRYFRPDLRFVSADVHSEIFDSVMADRINATADLLLVGGGGLIHTAGNEFWLVNMDAAAAENIRVPMLFYGLGYNNFGPDPLCPAAIENIKMLAEKSIGFSVRNDGSAGRLGQLGLNLDTVPDPGFFVDGNHPRPDIDGKYVMVQVAYDSPAQRNVADDVFFQNMVAVCKNIAARGYHVVLAPHCWPDIDISGKIVAACDDARIFMWDWFSIMRADNVAVGLGYYKHASFVLAMRGHAQICPIGMGVPVISIINHPKHMGLLQNIGQTDLAVMVNDANFIQKLYALIDFVEQNSDDIKHAYKSVMMQMTRDTQQYVTALAKRFDDAGYTGHIRADFYPEIKINSLNNDINNANIRVEEYARNLSNAKLQLDSANAQINRLTTIRCPKKHMHRYLYEIWKHIGIFLKQKGYIP